MKHLLPRLLMIEVSFINMYVSTNTTGYSVSSQENQKIPTSKTKLTHLLPQVLMIEVSFIYMYV